MKKILISVFLLAITFTSGVYVGALLLRNVNYLNGIYNARWNIRELELLNNDIEHLKDLKQLDLRMNMATYFALEYPEEFSFEDEVSYMKTVLEMNFRDPSRIERKVAEHFRRNGIPEEWSLVECVDQSSDIGKVACDLAAEQQNLIEQIKMFIQSEDEV